MKRTLVALAVIAAGLAAPAAADSGRTEYLPCGTEDAVNCVWDARHMGNGTGRSFFVGRDARVYPLPHHLAHYLIYGGTR